MSDSPNVSEAIRYTSNSSWWTPTLLLLLFLPAQISSGHSWWFLVDLAAAVLLLVVLYVFTHPTLTFSAEMISQHRGLSHVSIDLRDLQSVRANTVNRRMNVLDPQTGDRRSVIRWNWRSPDDWGGKPPVQAFCLRDTKGRHLALGVLRTGVDRWGVYLLRAIRENPEVELGPRVVDALNELTR